MPPTVLVCDDDEILVTLLESLLGSAGCRVVTALDGFQCIDKLHSERPDLLILDLDLPQKSGFDVLEQLSREGTLRRLPWLVLSGRERKDERERARQYGAKAYVIKPFHGGELVRTVHSILDSGAVSA